VATLVTEPLVQQWLEQTKLTVAHVPDELDQTAKDITFGRVSQVYDVSTWVDAITTPSLILRIMSMFIAAWMYESQYSEDLPIDANNWGVKLENMANDLLTQIADKGILLGDEPVPGGSLGAPVFYPTDVQDSDGMGEDRKFAMGKVF
jgi:hypothetical protein